MLSVIAAIIAAIVAGWIGYGIGHMRGYEQGNDEAEAALDVAGEPESIRGYVTLHDDYGSRQWTWTAKGLNNEVIASAWGYDTKANAKRAAKENMPQGCVLKAEA